MSVQTPPSFLSLDIATKAVRELVKELPRCARVEELRKQAATIAQVTAIHFAVSLNDPENDEIKTQINAITKGFLEKINNFFDLAQADHDLSSTIYQAGNLLSVDYETFPALAKLRTVKDKIEIEKAKISIASVIDGKEHFTAKAVEMRKLDDELTKSLKEVQDILATSQCKGKCIIL